MLRRRGFYIAGLLAVFLAIASGLWPGPKEEYDPVPAFQTMDAVPCGDGIDAETAFADMVHKVEQFKSVQYTKTKHRQIVTDKDTPFLPIKITKVVLSADGKYRYRNEPTSSNRMHSSTVIMDGEFSVSYSPDRDPKMVGIIPMATSSWFHHPETIVDFVSTTTIQATDFVGCKEFEGQKVVGYRRGFPDKHPRYDQFEEIWLSAETHLPVLVIETCVFRGRMVHIDPPGRRPRKRDDGIVEHDMRWTFSNFEWNASLDPALFEIEIPVGWFIVDLQGVEGALRAKIAQRTSSEE